MTTPATLTSSFSSLPITSIDVGTQTYKLAGHHLNTTYFANTHPLLQQLGYTQAVHNDLFRNLLMLPSTAEGSIATGAAWHTANHLSTNNGQFNFKTQ